MSKHWMPPADTTFIKAAAGLRFTDCSQVNYSSLRSTTAQSLNTNTKLNL